MQWLFWKKLSKWLRDEMMYRSSIKLHDIDDYERESDLVDSVIGS